MMSNKDRIIKYKNENPDASIREIQRALGVSSPSVVHFHIKSPQKHTKADLLAIVAALKKENEELEFKLKDRDHQVKMLIKIRDELRSRLSAYEEGIRPEDAKSSSDGLVYIVKLKSLKMMFLGMKDDDGIWACAHPLTTSGLIEYLDDEIEAAYPLPQEEKS